MKFQIDCQNCILVKNSEKLINMYYLLGYSKFLTQCITHINFSYWQLMNNSIFFSPWYLPACQHLPHRPVPTTLWPTTDTTRHCELPHRPVTDLPALEKKNKGDLRSAAFLTKIHNWEIGKEMGRLGSYASTTASMLTYVIRRFST